MPSLTYRCIVRGAMPMVSDASVWTRVRDRELEALARGYAGSDGPYARARDAPDGST